MKRSSTHTSNLKKRPPAVLRQAIKEFHDTEKKRLQSGQKTTDSVDYVTTNYQIAKGQITGDISREEFEAQQKVLATLAETSKYLAIETDIVTILERIAETVVTALGAQKANFWDFTPDKEGAYIMAAYGMQNQYVEHSRSDPMPLGEAWIGRALKTGQAWGTSDVQKDPLMPKSWRPAAKKQNYHGLLCMPLLHGDEIIGGFCIYHQDVHEWKFFEYEVMTIVANQAATALVNAQTFKTLEAERNKTQSIIDSLHDGLIMYDTEDRIQFLNPRAKELLRLKDIDLSDVLLDEAFVSSHKNKYLKNLLTIKQIRQTDYSTKEIEIATDKAKVLAITRIPVSNDKLQKVGELQILHDLTEEREVELMKSNFVSVASHQIRTPLTGVRWTIDVLRSQKMGELNAEQLSMLDKASVVTDHFSKLINDLLDVSRIDEGRMEFVFNLTDIEPIIDRVMHTLAPVASARSVKLTYTKKAVAVPSLSIDEGKIEIAIQNLIDNAIKYSKPGSGTVDITIHVEATSILLSVKDNGIGVPDHQKQFLFNKFFRAENAVRTVPNGSGLGLYLTKQIIEQHNGAIYFESKEGVGSNFMMQLPFSQKDQNPDSD